MWARAAKGTGASKIARVSDGGKRHFLLPQFINSREADHDGKENLTGSMTIGTISHSRGLESRWDYKLRTPALGLSMHVLKGMFESSCVAIIR